MKRKIKLNLKIIIISIALVGCKNISREAKLESTSIEYRTTVNFERRVEEILDQGPEYNSFLKLVNAASYFEEIYGRDDITIFIPTDEAFGPSLGTINELSQPENLERLRKILDYHVVKGEYDMENLKSTISLQGAPLRLPTYNGGYLAVKMENDTLKLLDESTNTVLIGEDCVQGSNGTVFTISRILQPRSQL